MLVGDLFAVFYSRGRFNLHNCSVTVKYGPKKKKKKQYSGENEEQLKHFAHSPRLLLEVQSNSAEVEPVREGE